MKTAARRSMAEGILKGILSRIQDLEPTERAFILEKIGYPNQADKMDLAAQVKQLGMPLAAERILQVSNLTVSSRFLS